MGHGPADGTVYSPPVVGAPGSGSSITCGVPGDPGSRSSITCGVFGVIYSWLIVSDIA